MYIYFNYNSNKTSTKLLNHYKVISIQYKTKLEIFYNNNINNIQTQSCEKSFIFVLI